MGNHGHFMLLVLDANQQDIMNSVQQCFSFLFFSFVVKISPMGDLLFK
jgi:hypothetical protein